MNSIILGAQNINEYERNNSSSGGMFPIFAKKILENGGIVYGAAYSDDFKIIHKGIDDFEDLYSLLGSKYGFSSVGKLFYDIEDKLKNGKTILFCGSPCQVKGLKLFLKKEYQKLYLLDFICHGTPASCYYNDYLNRISKGRKIKKINFRDKRKGWSNYHVRIDFYDGSYYMAEHKKDLYMLGMINNYTLRDACYNCKCVGINERISDITLGDLWGAEELAPSIYDDRGTSLVMIHTLKGKELFDSTQQHFNRCDIDVDRALRINSSSLFPAIPPKDLQLFKKDYNAKKDIIKTLNKYVGVSFYRRALRRIRKCLYKL